ncbi:MAG TPA: transglutaminase family protein [Ferruginibacter sp.]|jgi:transglutaminase-like putative cysteine protease|nr:transglutaminase family protein [Ferruginibacter sp.]
MDLNNNVPKATLGSGVSYKITHITKYKYEEAVSLCYNIAKLIPRDTLGQVCNNTVVTIHPTPDGINEYEDFFGNKVFYFSIQEEHEDLTVTVTSEVNKRAIDNFEYENLLWEDAHKMLVAPDSEFLEARQYIPETPVTTTDKEITAYALQSFTPGRQMFEAVYDLMQRIFKDFTFKSGVTTISTPLSVVMKERRGVCQDFAHLAIACVRAVGLPARYVSGYIETLPQAGQEKLAGADASHAWFSVFIPQTGWLDFDPTNNIIPSSQHVTIGWGRDYFDIAPLKGVILSSGSHRLSVSVDMRRID